LKQQAQVLTGAHAALISDDGRTLNLRIAELPQALQNSEWTVFPQTPSILLNAAVPVLTQREGSANVMLKISPERMDSPAQMSWLLVQGKADAPLGPQWVVSTPVQGQWQEISDLAQPNLGLPVVDNTLMPAPASTWIIALLGALLGGMLLNFMPCVFPVLAIKLLSITQHSDSPRAMKQSAFAFSAGVVLSFFILGGLVLGLREAGTQLGWGFQLQSPWVVGGLAMLFAVMGLNLSGMFEFRAMVPSGLASAQWSNPLVNSAWSGVFAVLIASPCTAPFMGASLGLAIGLPAWQALPIFLAMGIGMAVPFLALSYRSDWVRRLPKPGAWMLTFKQFMAFPMYATVIWLMWVLGQQVGLDGVTGFMACLLSLVLLIWALSLQGRVAHVMSALALVLLGLSLWLWAGNWTQATPVANPSEPKNQASAPALWQAWSADKVAQARQAGRPVFVDFTAAWCVTCQFNKKTTFSDAALLAQFAHKNVLLLKADWTRYDPAITAALNELGRNGVPVYAWYAPDQPVKLLSELPSVAEIQNQLNLVKTSP
jgi:thiol:disulfide interchange protein DsbD